MFADSAEVLRVSGNGSLKLMSSRSFIRDLKLALTEEFLEVAAVLSSCATYFICGFTLAVGFWFCWPPTLVNTGLIDDFGSVPVHKQFWGTITTTVNMKLIKTIK